MHQQAIMDARYGASNQLVRENVRAFNGDPERITLFGPDAGAASAGLLAMSPLTRSMSFLMSHFAFIQQSTNNQ